MKMLLLTALFFGSSTALAGHCDYARGLVVGALSITEYGTSSHYFTNREHAGAVYGTKKRQVKKLAKLIALNAEVYRPIADLLTKESAKLDQAAQEIYVPNFGLYERSIDKMDNALKQFSDILLENCK